MTQQTKVTTTPAQLVLRVVGVAFATVVLFVLLAVLGNGGGTAEAADLPAGLGTQVDGDGASGAAPGRAVADAVTSGLQPPTPVVAPTSDKVPPVVAPTSDKVPPVVVPVPHNLPPVAAPANDVAGPITDTVHPVGDAVVPVADTVTYPVVDVAGPVVAPVTDAVTPIPEPVVPPVPPTPESVGPVVAPVGPVVAPIPDGIQPNVDIVVPPATESADPSTAAPGAPDPAAEPTITPELVAGADDDAVASVVGVPTIETPAAATTGVDSTTWAVTAGSAVPAARSDADRGATVDGDSARSVSRTTPAPRPRSDPIGSLPGGSNAPGVLPSIVSGLLSGASSSSSSSPGDAPVAMLAVLTATAAAMFMLSRRVTAEVSWRSALVLSSVERPG